MSVQLATAVHSSKAVYMPNIREASLKPLSSRKGPEHSDEALRLDPRRPSGKFEADSRPASSPPTHKIVKGRDGDDFLARLAKVEETDNPWPPKVQDVSTTIATRPTFKVKIGGSSEEVVARLPTSEDSPSSVILPLLFSTLQGGQSTPRATGEEIESSRSGFNVPKNVVGKLEVTVIDHPKYPGVVVNELGSLGACAQHGMMVGHHITKINDIRVCDHRTAMWLADAAENRVRFTLGGSLRKYCIDRVIEGKLGDVGLTLVNNSAAGLGVIVAHVQKGLAADRAGIEVGHEILSVDNVLCWDHQSVIAQIDAARGCEAGRCELAISTRKITETNVLNQAIGQIPVDIVVVS